VQRAINQSIEMPDRLNVFLKKEKQTIKMNVSFEELKDFLFNLE
jgi:hypothetical protein